jgi:hypothetical protein
MSWPEFATGAHEFPRRTDGSSLSQRERARVREKSYGLPSRDKLFVNAAPAKPLRALKIFYFDREHR